MLFFLVLLPVFDYSPGERVLLPLPGVNRTRPIYIRPHLYPSFHPSFIFLPYIFIYSTYLDILMIKFQHEIQIYLFYPISCSFTPQTHVKCFYNISTSNNKYLFLIPVKVCFILKMIILPASKVWGRRISSVFSSSVFLKNFFSGEGEGII